MAEIVKMSSMKTTRLFSRRDPGSEQVELREKVIVRSVRGRLDVSVLRDLVAALDAAEVPSRAVVDAVIDQGRVTQLVVEADLEPVAEALPQDGPAGADAVAGGTR